MLVRHFSDLTVLSGLVSNALSFDKLNNRCPECVGDWQLTEMWRGEFKKSPDVNIRNEIPII